MQGRASTARASLFVAIYVLIAAAAFAALALTVKSAPYFPIDLAITRAVQSFRSPGLDLLMKLVGMPGYFPQTLVINVIFVIILYACRMRWGAVTLLVGAALTGGVGSLFRYGIDRARPTADLVWIAQLIEKGHYSFPSGHVLGFTAVLGFILFLGLTLSQPSWHRDLLVAVYVVYIALIGISRIYVGEHWPSDVLAGYLFGSIWLIFMILFYRWGRDRLQQARGTGLSGWLQRTLLGPSSLE